MVELQKKNELSVLMMSDMREGQIAEIISGKYEGEIVQYLGKVRGYFMWISIGKGREVSWHNAMKICPYKIRLLEDGETLVIKDNK